MKNLHRELSGVAELVPKFQLMAALLDSAVTNSNKFFEKT